MAGRFEEEKDRKYSDVGDSGGQFIITISVKEEETKRCEVLLT